MDQSNENKQINAAIRLACQSKFGVLDSNFLCQSVGVLSLPAPMTAKIGDSVEQVVRMIASNRTGCVVIVNESGKLAGILSERDCVMKLLDWEKAHAKEPIEKYMTRDPVAQQPDCTIAFALHLMSQGGFRHLPIVDAHNHPIALLSVKDVMDHIVQCFTDDLLNFDPEVLLPDTL
ncbi:MAG: CBS domain-containing protein [Deltaproteobacteria bacterium]|nr:CBS domain-containing protein [Deltaproteobacteria bacterium]